MPTYQYRCLDCKQPFEIFLSYSDYEAYIPVCLHCQSEHVQRRIGRIRIAKSDERRFENMADPAALEGLEDDPRALGRMMRQMGSELGEELPPEFDEVVDRLEKGQSPEEIEQALPDLADDAGMSDFDGGL